MVTTPDSTPSSSHQRLTVAVALVCAFVFISLRTAALPHGDSVDHQIDAMTPKQQVGQLLIVGFDGTRVGRDLRRMIRDWGVGGVVLYKRNLISASQTRRLTKAIKEQSGRRSAPFVAIDHEGGTVLRLNEGAPLLPGNMALGATASTTLARRAGASVGGALRRLGFTMNFAPVLDVYSNPASAIGTRSFGDSPEAVGALGAAFIEGQSSERIISVAKHFVGEGAAAGDSHEMTPWVRATAEEITARDVVPFRMAIASGLQAVMTSHAAAPALTGEGGSPMTLSPRVMTDLLRTQLGFQGLVITDALEMESISRLHAPGELALEAIDAGADLILAIGSQKDRDAIFATLVEARRTKRLTPERLRSSLRRILAAKEALSTSRDGQASSDLQVSTEIAEASLTIISGNARDANLSASPRGDIFYIGPDETLAELLGCRGVAIGPLRMLDDVYRRTKEIRALAGDARVIVGAFANARQAAVVDKVSAGIPGSRLVAISLGNPHDTENVSHAAVVVAEYSTTPAAQQAVSRFLHGELEARGRVPIAISLRPPTSESGRTVIDSQPGTAGIRQEKKFQTEREERCNE